MSDEDDVASPPTPKKLKIQSEEEPMKLLKYEHHCSSEEEEESKQIEEPIKLKTESKNEPSELLKVEDHTEEESKVIKDEEEEDDEPLLDMIDFPPSSTLPPTPPLPSSPRDLDMEQQDSDEDDGPPPGWDNKYQLKEKQAEQLATLAVTLTISSDIQAKDVLQDACNEEGEPRLQANPCLPPEVALSVEEHDSEDDGPPPGWDSKCQPGPMLQENPQSDMKMENVLQDAQNEGQPTLEVPADIIVDQEDSEDEGPPPGWDAKCQLEPKLQKTSQSDSSDIKMEQDAQNENGPQSQSQSRCSPAPDSLEVVPAGENSDIKVEEQDLEDDGPPPGWNSKCQPEPNLQMACPTTPPPDLKTEEDKEHALDNEGSPPGWGSTPQQQSRVHSSLPSPIDQSGTGDEPNNLKTIEESPQQLSRQQFIHPTKPQILVPKPPTTMNNPGMI